MEIHSVSSTLVRGRVLRIVAIISLGLVVLCGGVVTYVYLNFRNLAASVIRGPVLERLQSADLPADQKSGITNAVDQLTRAFREGRLSYGQLSQIFDRLERGPFFVLVDIESAKVRSLAACGSSAAERDEVVRVFQRLQRGVGEGRVSPEQARDVLASIRAIGSGNRRALKQSLTKDEAAALVAKAMREVNLAGIPNEPYIVDFTSRLQFEIADSAASPPSRASSAPHSAPSQ